MAEQRILLSHGDGGALTRKLIRELFHKHLGNPVLKEEDDAARLKWPVTSLQGDELAFTTDSFVVDPIFFPGGDIGKLAVFGTLNDLWVSGARPLFLSSSFIIEEGTSFDELERITRSMAGAASSQGVLVVAGDTKVVSRGKGDKVFITTSGVGVIPPGRRMPRKAMPRDRVLVSGPIGEHGLVIMAARMGLDPGVLTSDCGPVGPDLERLFESGSSVHMVRDPTRGGLASALKEIAEVSRCDILVYEEQIPVKPEVKEMCDLLGLDVLYLPCEGRAVAVVGQGPLPSGWVEIGEVMDGTGDLLLRTSYGGTRRMGLLEGIPLPRIC